MLFNTAVPFNVSERVDRTVRFVNYEKHGLNWQTCIWHTVQHLQVVVLRRGFTKPSEYSSYDIFQHSSQTMPNGDSTPTSRWSRTGRFVRTCRGTVLQYVENKVPLALKRNVAAHGVLNKICFKEGYLFGPKVCRSNLETPCILSVKSPTNFAQRL